MNQKEYNLTKQEILTQYGKPEYDLFEPVNESAKKLKELRRLYARSKQDLKRTAEVTLAIKKLAPLGLKASVVPEELVRPEWLVPFNKEQLAVIRQWLMNTRQGVDAIARIVKVTPNFVKQVLQSQSFRMLDMHLRQAYKEMLPLEAWARLRECFDSDNPNVKLNATKLILIDSGDIKPVQDENINKPPEMLDPDLQEKLRQKGDRLI